MRRLIALVFVLMPLGGCSVSSGDPTDPQTVSAAVMAALATIELGMEREDAVLASQAVDPEFFLGGNVSLRYSDTAWAGLGVGPFREFFSGSFISRANIEQDFNITDLGVTGTVAQATVTTRYAALRLDRSPPENLLAESVDTMVFQLSRGAWRLVGWDTVGVPEPPPAE